MWSSAHNSAKKLSEEKLWDRNEKRASTEVVYTIEKWSMVYARDTEKQNADQIV